MEGAEFVKPAGSLAGEPTKVRVHSYPKVYNLGHPALEALFVDPVIVEEKIDGSQFSFMVDLDGNLKLRSKGADIFPENPPKLFAMAVETVEGLFADGKFDDRKRWVYRGEAVTSPKHNCLLYEGIPVGGIILYDIEYSPNAFLSWEEKRTEAERLGLEVVPKLHEGKVTDLDTLSGLMERVSVLGGPTVEGLVFKNYKRFGRDGKVVMGKHVSEAFKEKNSKGWKKANPSKNDVLMVLAAQYRTEARWLKALQHLREEDLIEDDPRDIGKLMKAVHIDLDEEVTEEVAARLVKWAMPQVKRTATRGLPEWYKGLLAEKQFAAPYIDACDPDVLIEDLQAEDDAHAND
jgi:hypothetical protein